MLTCVCSYKHIIKSLHLLFTALFIGNQARKCAKEDEAFVLVAQDYLILFTANQGSGTLPEKIGVPTRKGGRVRGTLQSSGATPRRLVSWREKEMNENVTNVLFLHTIKHTNWICSFWWINKDWGWKSIDKGDCVAPYRRQVIMT